MAVNLKCSKKSYGIKKYSFCRKPRRSDGLLVQVHHTVIGSKNPERFVLGAFHKSENILGISDVKGNVFIVDLTYDKFWSLPSDGKCTAITFSSFNSHEVLIASSECSVKVINFENGNESTCLKGHTTPPTQLSCGGDGGKMLLSAATSYQNNRKYKDVYGSKWKGATEAILWDLSTCTRAHCLNVQSDFGIKQALFLSGVSSDCIITLFDDDSMCSWKLRDLGCANLISQPQKKEPHYWKSIACTRNGRAMVVGGKSHSLVAYSSETWEVTKVIELPDEVCGVKQLEFLPEPFDGGSNHVLAILSYDEHVRFLDLNTSTFVGIIKAERSHIYKLLCCSSGCYVACILQSGEVSIYCGSQILLEKKPIKLKVNNGTKVQHSVATCGRMINHENTSVNEEGKLFDDGSGDINSPALKKNTAILKEKVKSELNHKRLRLLLRHHGAFPARYRILAWRTVLLQLPCNHKAFAGLMSRGIHPAYAHLEQKYPLENLSELKLLKKLISCLAHWSPLFSQVNYLPLFVYPFIKLFIHDVMGCFEALATILLNYCQHWFEFFPFPPINVLAAVENLLSYHDPNLIDYFMKKGVDTRVYAWPLLQVAFSEVLSNKEWLQFWDHVLVNEPSFLLAAVPAYCIVSRTALLRCKNMDDFQFFFRNQNPVDMEKFISKVYFICQNTPSDFHPRKHLLVFEPLPKGDTYPVFNHYPKVLVDANVEKLKRLQLDEEALISQKLKLLKSVQEKEEQKIQANNAILKQKYLKELEKAYQYALKMEEDKVSRHYVELLNLKRDLLSTNCPGNVENLTEGDCTIPPCYLDGNPHLSQKQERNEDYSSTKITPDLHRKISSRHYVLKQQENELHGCLRRPNGPKCSKGEEALLTSVAPGGSREEMQYHHVRSEDQQIGIDEECHDWFTMRNRYKISPSNPKVERVQSNAESSESPVCRKSQGTNLSKIHEKRRWKISRNTSSGHAQDYLDLDGVFTKNYSDMFKKEQEAIGRAMEARLKVCLW